MTPEQFAYWLQGFAELTDSQAQPSPAQWQAIKDHLDTVFNKVTPPLQHVTWPSYPPGVRTLEHRPGVVMAPGVTTTPYVAPAHDQLARTGTPQLGTNIVC